MFVHSINKSDLDECLCDFEFSCSLDGDSKARIGSKMSESSQHSSVTGTDILLEKSFKGEKIYNIGERVYVTATVFMGKVYYVVRVS